MKKTLIVIIMIFIIIILFLFGMLQNNKYIALQISKENSEYEQYFKKEIIGTELASLINKVTDKNNKNDIPKDENGYYIDNQKNSIRIDIKMTTVENTYPMETIVDNDVLYFVKNFNSVQFKCIDIDYHKETGKVSKLIFEEIQEEKE